MNKSKKTSKNFNLQQLNHSRNDVTVVSRIKLIIISSFIALLSTLIVFAEELPFSSPYTPQLKQSLLTAFQSQTIAYKPRTAHLCSSGKGYVPCYINRLMLANSPYLLQHAHNPINWFEWGKEALAKAKKENKPIFLSIGYAACHWCHRMEEESFDHLNIAKILNQHYIAIKVDRESSPELDAFYGQAVQYFQGYSGWPMTLILTPDGKAFHGGGYYSNKNLVSLLLNMNKYWTSKEPELRQVAQQLINDLTPRQNKLQQGKPLDAAIRSRAINDLLSFVDGYHGGFGEGQKFPRESWLFLLLSESYARQKNEAYDKTEDAFSALSTTLDHMARGGIYDQLGGGFHRYAIDPNWQTPHFEKMLYNQALLIRLYLAAYTIKSNPYYLRIVEQTLHFVLSQMQAPQGGFYASLDADTENKEGGYYLWTLEEFVQAIDKKMININFATQLFDVDKYGEVDQANVLSLSQSFEESATDNNLSLPQFMQAVDKLRQYLIHQRQLRQKPLRDEKIILGWNGLMISALAQSSRFFSASKNYLTQAIKAANHLWLTMSQAKFQAQSQKNNQSWYRIQFNGVNSKPAQLQDYAYFLQALIDLYDVTQEDIWLKRSEHIVDIMFSLFWDNANGGFFQSPMNKNTPMPIRLKSAFDKTLPAANAIAAQSLLRLNKRTGKEKYKIDAMHIFSTFASDVYQTPSAYSGLHLAAHEQRHGQQQLPIFAANGNIHIDAKFYEKNKSLQLVIELKLKPKWHINAAQVLEKHLIPTQIKLEKDSLWKFDNIVYPKAKKISLGFNEEPLALYQASTKIMATLITKKQNIPHPKLQNPMIKLNLQACNDKMCLLPEEFLLYPTPLKVEN